MSALAFEVPDQLSAHEPPAERDAVRMLVARGHERSLVHTRFRALPEFLEPGDLVVVNASATLPAAVRVVGSDLVLHLSSTVPDAPETRWVVEVRRGSEPYRAAVDGCTLELPDGAWATVLAPYLAGRRLWVADLHLRLPLEAYLARHGRPIRYRYVRAEHPLAEYQTVFATEPGSAEMPSAGRPFTAELVTHLVSRGIAVAPIVLHTGVSSLEAGEPPYPERFSVPPATARLVAATRAGGGRVIAVGTTVVRALESAARADGSIAPAEGWTNLVVTPERGVRIVDGLLTGWHEPEASHLQLLEAVAGHDLVQRSYRVALRKRYLWHEFGDVHLLLP
jgi:S-adenosylmethionine:tRNA ribosyltransferase-isomerase